MLDKIKDAWGNKSKMISLSLKKNFVKDVSLLTSFMDALNPTFTHRCFSIINNLVDNPKCPNCGKSSALNKTYPNLGYQLYCGQICARSHGKLERQKINPNTLESKDWLVHQRIELKKSIEQIALDLNISISPVMDALRLHNIAGVIDARSRNTIANRCLSDRMQLEHLYYDLGMNMEAISIHIGSSASTVSRWFDYHNIETKKSNSYPRKHVKVSKPTQEIFDLVSTYFPDAVLNDRSILNGLEIDILIPSKSFAIEFNGVYSHLYRPDEKTWSGKKDATYHLFKTEAASKKGINLIHIFSDEWRDKKQLLQSMILQRLGISTRTIFARKCEIREVAAVDKNTFLNMNHIQGEDRSKVKLGLFYDDELVSIMTFSKPRFNKKVSWELSRFSVKSGISIPGGFSKLLTYFRKYNSGSIVSYADRRYSVGNVYEKNGFVKVKVNAPGYFYVKSNTEVRMNRMHFQKHKIRDSENDNRSEYDIAKSLGFDRIYDCGNITYLIG